MNYFMNKFEINDRIKEFMLEMGLNQNQFSLRLNTSSSRISNIINKRNRPDSDILAKICHVFTNVNARWLLTGEGDMIYDSSQMLKEPLQKYGRKEEEYYKLPIDFVEKINYIEQRLGEIEKKQK